MTNKSVMQILIEIGETSSRKQKEEILNLHKDNQTLINTIKAALDPYTNYYIKKIPVYSSSTNEEHTLDWALAQLEQFSSRKVTGNKAIDSLSDILSSLSAEDSVALERVIQKNLNCGISTSTVNKVFGKGFIQEYPVMLCEKFYKKFINKLDWNSGVRVDLKEDGMRINVHVNGQLVEIKSRSGREVEVHNVFDEQMVNLATLRTDEFTFKRTILDVVFDGEMVAVDEQGKLLPRKESNGLCNKAIKGTISRKEAEQLRISLWDIIPSANFKKGYCPAPLIDRTVMLEELHLEAKQRYNMSKVTLTPNHHVTSLQQAQELFLSYLADGKEGVILKNPNSPWEDKRSQHWIKMKGEEPCELRVVGVIEGEGKYVGMMGALKCESEDGLLKVNVGSGFKDSERNLELYKNLPMIIEVQYNEKIKDKNGNVSLFLPIFKGIRLDKDVANTLAEIS